MKTWQGIFFFFLKAFPRAYGPIITMHNSTQEGKKKNTVV